MERGEFDTNLKKRKNSSAALRNFVQFPNVGAVHRAKLAHADAISFVNCNDLLEDYLFRNNRFRCSRGRAFRSCSKMEELGGPAWPCGEVPLGAAR